MAVFKARSADDLTILRAGMCPDCGAAVSRGMTACNACGLQFTNHLDELPIRRAPAPPAAPSAPPAWAPPPAAAPPAPQAYAPPAVRVAPVEAPREDPTARGRPLTLDDIELIERGPLKANQHPLTDAEAPDVVDGAAAPLLGASLSRAAIVVMADAAVCDDPFVLLGFPPVDSHVARAGINLRRADAADVDDPEGLAVRGAPSSIAPKRTGVVPAVRPAAPAPSTSPSTRGLSLEDLEGLEFPIHLEQAHSFAELVDTPDGVSDPLLGAALIRGATAAMADAAVVDDPLVLLGYPPVVPLDVARAMINLRRSDSPIADDVETLLQRRVSRPATAPGISVGGPAPVVAPSTKPPTAARPVVAPRPVPAPSVVVASGPVRRADPDATAMLDQDAINAAVAAVQRERQAGAPPPQQQPPTNRRPATSVSGRGGARSLDDT